MQKLRRRAASEQHLKHQIAQCDVPSFERSDFPFSVTARGPLVRSVSPRAANQRSGARASAISRYKRVVSFSQMTTAAFSSGRKMLLLVIAREIWARERQQAEAIKAGRALRTQLDFARYLQKRTADPSHTFRDHLRNIDGAIEE